MENTLNTGEALIEVISYALKRSSATVKGERPTIKKGKEFVEINTGETSLEQCQQKLR